MQVTPVAADVAAVLAQIRTILMHGLLVASRLFRVQIAPVLAAVAHVPVQITTVMANISAIVTQVELVLMDLLLIRRCIAFRRLRKRGEYQTEYRCCKDKAGFRHFGLPLFFDAG